MVALPRRSFSASSAPVRNLNAGAAILLDAPIRTGCFLRHDSRIHIGQAFGYLPRLMGLMVVSEK